MAASMYIAEITPTTRQAGRGHDWQRWPSFTVRRPTMATLRDELRTYGTPRYPIYQDRKDSKPRRVGHIYTSIDQEDGKTYYRQNWVSIYSVHPVTDEDA